MPASEPCGSLEPVTGEPAHSGWRRWQPWGLVLLSVALPLAVGVLVSCSTPGGIELAPPAIADATFVGNRTCYDCHTNLTRVFASSPHARLHFEGVAMAEPTGCEGCHGPGSRHVAAGGGRGRFILNPRRDPQTCFNCHLEVHTEFNLPQRHPVIEGKMTCVQCHDPHGMDIQKPAWGLAMARLNEHWSASG